LFTVEIEGVDEVERAWADSVSNPGPILIGNDPGDF
jgi:hypothetical protein